MQVQMQEKKRRRNQRGKGCRVSPQDPCFSQRSWVLGQQRNLKTKALEGGREEEVEEEVHQKQIEEQEEPVMMRMKMMKKEEQEEKEWGQQRKQLKQLQLLLLLLVYRDGNCRSGTLRHWEGVCNREDICLDRHTP